MPLSILLQLAAITVGLCLLASCAMPGEPTPRNRQLILALEHEMQTNTGWIQVHAADALLDHGEKRSVSKIFSPMVDSASTYRIGVWRVMARAAENETERQLFINRIRGVTLDSIAPDRLQAAESLAKLNAVEIVDRGILQQWLLSADEATAAFVRWLMLMSASPTERANDEVALAALLDSDNAIARLRAAVALGRLQSISPASLERLRQQINLEPKESIGRVYVVAANLRKSDRGSKQFQELKSELVSFLSNGKPNEQLEAATVIGEYGDARDVAVLDALLTCSEADARIGAASGLLYLLK